jgi:hypothetical protein
MRPIQIVLSESPRTPHYELESVSRAKEGGFQQIGKLFVMGKRISAMSAVTS